MKIYVFSPMTTQQAAFDYNSDGIEDLINTYTFNDSGWLTTIGIDYDADGTSDITYTYTYDANGDLLSESTSFFSFLGVSGSNPTTSNIFGNAIDSPLDYSTSVWSDDYGGGTVETVISDANGPRATVSVSYIEDGVIEDRVDIIVEGVSDSNTRVVNLLATRGNLKSLFYDENDRLVREISGFDDNPGTTITYEYDSAGRLARESYDYEPDGVIDDVYTYIQGADAVDDSVSTQENALLSGDVFADNGNGVDENPVDGQLSVVQVNGLSEVGSQVTLASGAIATVDGDGTFSYNPNGQFDFLEAGEVATDSFTYTVDGGNGLLDTATVTVSISGVEDSDDASFWFSPDRNSTLGQAKDILSFDGDSFNTFFDGSALGLTAKIDAFDIVSDTEILMSFHKTTSVGGLTVSDTDVVKFTATSLGANNTSGSFELYLRGSDIGLTSSGEDIDALSTLTDGSLIFSTTGRASMANGLKSRDEDLVRYDPITGELSLYFDGNDVGLSGRGNDINAVSLLDGDLMLSMTSLVSELSLENEDVIRYTPTSIGEETAGVFDSAPFFDGSMAGFTGNIAAIDLTIG